MEKYSRYYGVLIIISVVLVLYFIGNYFIAPMFEKREEKSTTLVKKEKLLEKKRKDRDVVRQKVKKIQDASATAQKKVYAPVESDLGNDTLFFTLYNDVIEMMHSNSLRIKSIDYVYNPQGDEFVKAGKDYFVFDVNVELVSNYTNLGKFIQDLYQYPYYIKILDLKVKPYNRDKKILISDLSIRLYAHTDPERK
jgi:Tfp pilus assembly protein PilO